ncbi:MAG: xanthine dehydrogenase family protein molybdopterin-binding subunit [Candidatus Bipolaricaulota bacterium]|nr:xanthine dehydrogenase family protein molybdopterin-binding subunit [Candidatus Bipolaricaulota bacterium]MCS7275343.1 xanthine dehydrogenase family protein molybdopterin-binding subunit [Candidatus Bipolaricaulota bacterium]MDW8110158.1 xanthine dehydrogenase family protein molybdopterin-binding subunit [Candidatus Bipolaricaulota bacterium]MDW8329190.1 xanthine dehydrogenase family protein molybdopterin-binding subunit [Candidatus Bipolaricaulota bacterium]
MSGDFAVVGKALPKVDGLAKCTGQTKYADDLSLPRMLYGKLLRSPHPHAKILRIDASKALALPGVFAVITGKDLPIKFGIMPSSQDEHALAVDKVRYVGDPVAAVAAIDEETAERACELIEVEYQKLPAIMTIEEALKEQNVRIHEDFGAGGNLHKVVALEFGNVDEGFQEAEYIREDLFFYQGSTHLPMEQHACLAQYDLDGKITLWSSTQTPHYVHRALAKVLQMPESKIRVIAPPVGGGFGGKDDPFSHEICAAKLAMLTGRPVKITLTRDEVFYTHRGRHPVLMWVKTGVKRDGRITAMHFRSFLDGGAHGSYGVATTYYTGALQPVTYKIPHYKFEAVRVFTNKPPCGPKRAHGTPQPRYALEIHMDKLAEDLGLDPVEMRRRNLTGPHHVTVNWLKINSNGVRECLEKVVEASGYQKKRKRGGGRRGVGLAISTYICGAGLPIYWNDMPQSEVHLKIDRTGRVTAFSGAIDIGQGSNTMLATFVAEVLGLRPEEIALVTADTDLTPIDLGSYSSRVTMMMGHAAIQAAEKLKKLLFEAVSEKLGVPTERLVARDHRIYDRENPAKSIAFDEAARLAEAKFGTLAATGSYWAPKKLGTYKGSGVGPSPAYSFSACVAEVECDPETGQINVEKIWLAHDIGRPINETLVIGQVEGSVYMGLGEVLMEEQEFRNRLGIHKIPSLLDYKSLTTKEMPPVETFLIYTDEPNGPFGAKEAGQGPLSPVIPAVANAVYDALGIRIDEIPITPEKVLKALEDKAKGGKGRVGPERMPDFQFPAPIKVEPPK